MSCDYCGAAAQTLAAVAPRWSTPDFAHVCQTCERKLQALIDAEYDAITPRVKAAVAATRHTTPRQRTLAQRFRDLLP